MKLWQRIAKRKVDRALANELLDKAKKEVEKMPPINILVAGKTGSGKSTLINALFRDNIAKTGVGMPVTQHVERLTKEGVPLTLFDTKGLELTASSQQEVLKSFAHLINHQRSLGDDKAIHIVYYCINATMARIEPLEIEIIQALAKELPVILVLTQSIGEDSKQFYHYVKDMALPVKAVVPILAKEYVIAKQTKIASYGLQTLIDWTLKIIPSKAHQAFINAQQIDMERKINSARSWAKKYVTTSFGVGFMPIPVSDATVLVPMQITMLGHITAIFGLSLDKAQIVSLLAGIGGTGGVTMLGKYMVGNVLKLFPGAGTVAGGFISGATASSLTIALAYSYIEVLRRISEAEQMGRDLKLNELQRIMNQSLEEQLKVASQFIPAAMKEQLPEWLHGFLNQESK
ncbi:50S ribosome-binding GTPase [Tuanshanicoccus lijuaniae]|uniref:GTPase n=1 Tax=Aerococcaceae bacterium zg-1292 TaxID=2774330 RepID=UPI0019362BE8|nr:50S ribosome-binding GTPase [Aerococcaceae bacterium zg-1292]MBF6625011.1 50S ribosome-binding GTPase [Aerococcaceae bacterium zg-BR9]MBF6626278.1 50S ribosome-binding GTPase [Aerococcaceae bacterium zg-BR9]QQA37581.1 50S ribosome-binding GTPase [Aerococcaceae bacterium zg-1292]